MNATTRSFDLRLARRLGSPGSELSSPAFSALMAGKWRTMCRPCLFTPRQRRRSSGRISRSSWETPRWVLIPRTRRQAGVLSRSRNPASDPNRSTRILQSSTPCSVLHGRVSLEQEVRQFADELIRRRKSVGGAGASSRSRESKEAVTPAPAQAPSRAAKPGESDADDDFWGPAPAKKAAPAPAPAPQKPEERAGGKGAGRKGTDKRQPTPPTQQLDAKSVGVVKKGGAEASTAEAKEAVAEAPTRRQFPCQCMGSTHRPMGNCLRCGKISCEYEVSFHAGSLHVNIGRI
jgi:hypothetical protein